MEAKLPNLISHKRILEDTTYDDYIYLRFQTKKPYIIDDVLDMLENDAHLYLAYHLVASDSLCGRQCLAAFAHPDNMRMYQFNVFSDGDNKVTEVHVKLYETLEIYFATIIGENADMASQGMFKRVMSDEKILRIALSCSD